MNNYRLIPLYEQVLLNEYSEGYIKAQTARLKKIAGAYVEEETIRQMIQRFDQLKTGATTKARIVEIVNAAITAGDIAPANPKDAQRIEKLKANPFQLEFYNWSDLEKVVHQFRDPSEKKALKAAAGQAENTGATLIYEDPKTGLQIFWGRDANECYIFKQWIANKKNQGHQAGGRNLYGWCISYPPERGNLFNSYRFGGGSPDRAASVYFVYDPQKAPTDRFHVFVVHVFKNGKFMVTSSLNDGDATGDWNSVVSVQPKLKGLERFFVFHKFTEKEQLYQIIKDAGPKDFAEFTFNAKRAYIDTRRKIYSADYIALPADLQHAYINVRAPDANDENITARVLKLINLFADTSINDANTRIKRAKMQADKGDPDWEEPLYDDPAMKQSKQSQIVKYWRKLINDSLNDLGAASRNATRT